VYSLWSMVQLIDRIVSREDEPMSSLRLSSDVVPTIGALTPSLLITQARETCAILIPRLFATCSIAPTIFSELDMELYIDAIGSELVRAVVEAQGRHAIPLASGDQGMEPTPKSYGKVKIELLKSFNLARLQRGHHLPFFGS
jgi:hypothetical protein